MTKFSLYYFRFFKIYQYINFKKFFVRILAPPSGRRPGADAPPAPPLATPLLEPSTAAKPVPLESANTRPPKHDVCISGLKKATSNDDVHAHLMDLGVSDIVSISRISDESSVPATFRITINDHSIKHNAYDRNGYKEGIKVIPYRFYKTDKMQPSMNS